MSVIICAGWEELVLTTDQDEFTNQRAMWGLESNAGRRSSEPGEHLEIQFMLICKRY